MEQKKALVCLGIFGVAFVGFSFFMLRITEHIDTLTFDALLVLIFLSLFFLLVQIAAVVYAAILPSSLIFAIIPAAVALFAGGVVFGMPFEFLIVLGFPLSLLLWSVKWNMKNRIKIEFRQDVRRPLTMFFFLIILFGCFMLTPWATKELQENSFQWFSIFLPEKIQIDADTSISIDLSPSEYVEEQSQKLLKSCQGEPQCETMIKEEAFRQADEMIAAIPLLQGTNSRSTEPFAQIVVRNMVQNFIDQPALNEMEKSYGIPPEMIIGLFLFVLISPFSIILSFITMFILSIFYYVFRITGIFQMTHENVQKEVII